MLRTALVLTCLSLVSSARADTTDADKLFQEGRALAKAGDFQGACDRFEKSFAVDPSPGTQLNIGDCQEHLGHTREAWEAYNAAADEYDRTGEAARAKFAHGRADAIAGKLAEVDVLVVDPSIEGLAISISGRDTKPAVTIHDRVEPGTVTITATAPGMRPFESSSQATAGARVVVMIPKTLGAEPAPPPKVIMVVHEDRHKKRVHLAYWLAGGGVAAAGGSLAFTLIGRSHYNTVADGPHCAHVSGGITCDTTGATQIHDAQRLADIGTGFAIAAGALVATAAIVYFTAPPETTVIAPTVTAQSVGFTVLAHF